MSHNDYAHQRIVDRDTMTDREKLIERLETWVAGFPHLNKNETWDGETAL